MAEDVENNDALLSLKKMLEKKDEELKSLQKDLAVQKEENVSQKEIIENQRDVALRQHDEIALHQKEITSSFTYGSRIQTAMLTPESQFEKYLKDYFVFFRPRDIVSGDFYWLTPKNGKIVVVAADATGHGVPGAFMSLMGMVFLNDIVNTQSILEPNQILQKMREKIVNALEQSEDVERINAGMDICLVVIDPENKKLKFSGAFNPLIIIRDEQFTELKADKMPVGFHPYSMDKQFTCEEHEYRPGDRIYMFSDGFIDQFGWRNNKKYMKRNFKKLILDIQNVPVKAQKILFENHLDNWKGDLEQIDDIVVLGIEL